MLSNNLIILKPYIEKLKNRKGSINITIDDEAIILDNKSLVGDALESWIINYLSAKKKSTNISVEKNEISQTFPDAYLTNLNLETESYLEIKTFDISSGPSFDIANFHSYVDSVMENPSKLDADYLVIGYSLIDGILEIKDIWYKKVWELCCKSADWNLRLQVKREVIYNIRPFNLIGRTKFPPFKTKMEFIDAIQGVLDNYNQTKFEYSDWKKKLLKKL